MKYLVVIIAFRVIIEVSSEINDPTTIIQGYPDHPEYENNFRSVHVVNYKGEVYFVRGGDEQTFLENDIPYPVTALFTFTKDNGVRKRGEIYYGTTNGVYVRKSDGSNTPEKLNGIEDSISFIQEYPVQVQSSQTFGGVHVVTVKGDVFYVRGSDGVVLKQTDVPFPVITMHTITKDGENHKIGDTYFGTTMGVYYRKTDEDAYLIDLKCFPVKLFQEYPDNFPSVHVISEKGEVYHIKGGYESAVKQRSLPFPATTMHTFANECGVRKAGDIYFGTTDGVYLRKADESTVKRISVIHDEITLIQEYPDSNCSVYVLNLKGDVYFISGKDDSVSQRTDIPFPVTIMYTPPSSDGNPRNLNTYFGTTNGVFLFGNTYQ